MVTTADAVTTRPPLTVANRVGLVLAALLGVADLVSIAMPTDPDQPGPPMAVLVVGMLLGVVTLAAVVLAWVTRRRAWSRVTAGSRIVSALTALPAFFVPDVPPALVASAAVAVAVTAVAVVLLLRRPRSAH
jgi:hypothetical protein